MIDYDFQPMSHHYCLRPLTYDISDICTAIKENSQSLNQKAPGFFCLSEMNGFSCLTFLLVFFLVDIRMNQPLIRRCNNWNSRHFFQSYGGNHRPFIWNVRRLLVCFTNFSMHSRQTYKTAVINTKNNFVFIPQNKLVYMENVTGRFWEIIFFPENVKKSRFHQ